jgi:hypothetical protein
MTQQNHSCTCSSTRRPKTIITTVLLLFVFASVVFLVAKEFRKSSASPGETTPQPATQNALNSAPAVAAEGSAGPSHKVIAYYFHGTFRCPTCRIIEAYTQEAVEGGFAPALKDGRLEWQVLNVEDPGNEHFAKDYQLFTKSVVIADFRDGKQVRWKNLKNVWQLTGNKDGFLQYIRDEVSSYLEGK